MISQIPFLMTTNINYKNKLDEIASIIFNADFDEHYGLLSGKCGIALFLSYYAKYSHSDKYLEKAQALLEQSFDDVNDGNLNPSYSAGLGGLGWTLEHLVKNSFVDLDTDDVLAPMDKYIDDWQKENLKNRDFDYLHNGLGASMYFLSRGKLGEQYLRDIPKLLQANAEIDPDFIEVKWQSEIGIDTKKYGYNFGLSHGIPSIIALLAKFVKNDVDKDLSIKLLRGATNYIVMNGFDADELSEFPYSIVEGKKPNSSRLAWCYGDLGVAIALYQASKVLEDDELRDYSIGVLKKSCQRRDLKENGVVDAGLCHGTTGNAHMYNRMYLETGDDVFKEAAEYWFKQTLEFAHFEDGYAGFKQFRFEDEEVRWENSYGFLEGISGIGLALISFVSDIEPVWDESLLMS